MTFVEIVLVDFYTSRCSNCLAAVPHVAELYRRYHHQRALELKSALSKASAVAQNGPLDSAFDGTALTAQHLA
jgi:thiol-disulfide isomerase/thioredoxin